MYSGTLVIAFLAAENENRQLGDLPQADFDYVPERFLLSVRTKSITLLCLSTFFHLEPKRQHTLLFSLAGIVDIFIH